MALQREYWVSVEEYLAIDRASTDVKYEYMDGHMYAMSGETIDHAEIAANLFFLLSKIWAYQHFGPGQQVALGCIGFALPIADLYVNTDVPERESEEE